MDSNTNTATKILSLQDGNYILDNKYTPVGDICIQGSTAANVTIQAADGYRHFIKYKNVIQIMGTTLTGLGGSNVNRGGIELRGTTVGGK